MHRLRVASLICVGLLAAPESALATVSAPRLVTPAVQNGTAVQRTTFAVAPLRSPAPEIVLVDDDDDDGPSYGGGGGGGGGDYGGGGGFGGGGFGGGGHHGGGANLGAIINLGVAVARGATAAAAAANRQRMQDERERVYRNQRFRDAAAAKARVRAEALARLRADAQANAKATAQARLRAEALEQARKKAIAREKASTYAKAEADRRVREAQERERDRRDAAERGRRDTAQRERERRDALRRSQPPPAPYAQPQPKSIVPAPERYPVARTPNRYPNESPDDSTPDTIGGRTYQVISPPDERADAIPEYRLNNTVLYPRRTDIYDPRLCTGVTAKGCYLRSAAIPTVNGQSRQGCVAYCRPVQIVRPDPPPAYFPVPPTNYPSPAVTYPQPPVTTVRTVDPPRAPPIETAYPAPRTEPEPQRKTEPATETVYAAPRTEPEPQRKPEPATETVYAAPRTEPTPQRKPEPATETVYAAPRTEPMPQRKPEPATETVYAQPRQEPEPNRPVTHPRETSDTSPTRDGPGPKVDTETDPDPTAANLDEAAPTPPFCDKVIARCIKQGWHCSDVGESALKKREAEFLAARPQTAEGVASTHRDFVRMQEEGRRECWIQALGPCISVRTDHRCEFDWRDLQPYHVRNADSPGVQANKGPMPATSIVTAKPAPEEPKLERAVPTLSATSIAFTGAPGAGPPATPVLPPSIGRDDNAMPVVPIR